MGIQVLCVCQTWAFFVLLAATREPHVKGGVVSMVLGRLGRAVPIVIHDGTIPAMGVFGVDHSPKTTATLSHKHNTSSKANSQLPCPVSSPLLPQEGALSSKHRQDGHSASSVNKISHLPWD